MTTPKPNKNISVTVRLDEETWTLLNQINRQDRRSGVSDVARLLLLRGKELYEKDGKLFDDATPKQKALRDEGKKENSVPPRTGTRG